MNRNTILVIVISVIILSSIGITFYFLNGTSDIPTNTISEPIATGGDAFPTGDRIGGTDNTSGGNVQNGNDTTGSNTAEQITDTSDIQIKKVSDISVAGMTFVNKNGQNFLRYIEKGTGHIKEMSFNETIPTDVTNTTITAVFDSFWSKDGNNLIFRRLDGINNFIQTIYGVVNDAYSTSTISEVGIKKLNTTLLPSNTLGVAVSPDKNKIIYLVQDGENTLGILSDFGKNGPSDKKIQIWKSPTKEWSVSWPSLNKISLLTKPSSNVGGYFYTLGTDKNNVFEKILGDVKGLTAKIGNDDNVVLYSETTGTGFMTYYFELKNEGMAVFPVQTLPEKCVLSKLNSKIAYCGVPDFIVGSKYPDAWYQGITSFSDSIYKVDLDVNYSGKIIGQEKLGGDTIDVINPILSEDENHMAFMNKKDNTLWMVKVR